MVEPLAGKVAWVAGVGEGVTELERSVGEASALLLAARGARVLVTGAHEKALGACVGEIAHAGGHARHLVTELRTAEDARTCVDGARERYGALDVAVFAGASLEGIARAFDAARDAMRPGGRLVLIAPSESEPRASAFVREVARVFAPRGITCNAVLLAAKPAPIRVAEPEDVAELVAFLSGTAGEVVSGATLTVT